MAKLIGAIIGVAVLFALSFGFTALIYYGICWAFGFTFTWKIAFGVYLVLFLVGSFFRSSK